MEARYDKKYLKFVNATKVIGAEDVDAKARELFYKNKNIESCDVLEAAAASILVNKLSSEEVEVVKKFLTYITGYYSECGVWGNACAYTDKDFDKASSKDTVVLYKEESDK